MKVKIRKIKEEDFEKGFLETLSNLSPVGLTSKKAREIYKKYIRNNSVYNIFVAELENKVVGAITLLIEQKFIHSGGKVGHIEDVVVREKYQGKGIGKALVKKVITEAKRQNCYKIILDCSKGNIPFYKKIGFRRHEIEMRMDL